VRPPNGGLLSFSGSAHTQRVSEREFQDPLATPFRHDRAAKERILTIASTCALLCTLFGCSGSPSRNILGSYFPSWMVCALVGLVVALAARAGLKAAGLLSEVPAPLLVLLSFGCATTFALWLVWLA
jgi:hypothetical protein